MIFIEMIYSIQGQAEESSATLQSQPEFIAPVDVNPSHKDSYSWVAVPSYPLLRTELGFP